MWSDWLEKPLLNCIISLEFSLNTPAGLLFLFACHNNGRGKAITKFLQNNKNLLLTYLYCYTIDGGHHHVKLFTFTRVRGRKSLLQYYSKATLKWCDSYRRDYCFACSSTLGTNVAAHYIYFVHYYTIHILYIWHIISLIFFFVQHTTI